MSSSRRVIVPPVRVISRSATAPNTPPSRPSPFPSHLLQTTMSLTPHQPPDMKPKIENNNKDGVGIIPTDLLFDILIRLSVKTLSRFKLVSKPWQSLIQDQEFVRSHYRRSQQDKHTSRQYLNVELSPYNKEEEGGQAKCYEVDKHEMAAEVNGPVISYRAKAFCHGLVCYLGMHEDVHVVNPVTQQALTLPKPPCLTARRNGISFQHRRHALGFGFDSVSSKYKVVIVVSGTAQTGTTSYRSQLAEMFVLSSKSKSWKKIDCSMLETRVPFIRPPVYVNGASHWISSYNEEIVSFNFTQEKFGVIPVRKEMKEFFSEKFDHKWRLCKKREHLCVLGIVGAFGAEEVKLWTLTNYDDATPEWVVQEIILPYKLIEKRVGFITAATGDDELWIVCCDHKTYIYSYNEHGVVVNSREVCNFPENYGFTGFYVESLVNPHVI